MPVKRPYSLRDLYQLKVYFKDGRIIGGIGDDFTLGCQFSLSFHHRDIENITRIEATFGHYSTTKKIVRELNFKVEDGKLTIFFPIDFIFTAEPILSEEEKREREEKTRATMGRLILTTSADYDCHGNPRSSGGSSNRRDIH